MSCKQHKQTPERNKKWHTMPKLSRIPESSTRFLLGKGFEPMKTQDARPRRQSPRPCLVKALRHSFGRIMGEARVTRQLRQSARCHVQTFRRARQVGPRQTLHLPLQPGGGSRRRATPGRSLAELQSGDKTLRCPPYLRSACAHPPPGPGCLWRNSLTFAGSVQRLWRQASSCCEFWVTTCSQLHPQHCVLCQDALSALP